MDIIRKKESAYQQFLVYTQTIGITTAITKTLVAPLERYRLIMQTQNVLMINERAKFKSFTSYFQRIPKEQGFLAFYRGNFANLLVFLPQSIGQFMFYDNIQRFFFPAGQVESSAYEFIGKKGLCALFGGSATLLLTYPLDTIKTRLSLEFQKQKQDRIFKGVFQTILETRERQGFRAIYNGFLLQNFINIPQFIVIYMTIDILKNISISQSDLLKYIGVSSVGAFVAHLSVYPLDTIKRRIQMNGYNRLPIYKGSLDCLKQIHAKEGLKGLYSGVAVSSLKYIIAITAHATILSSMVGKYTKSV